MTIVTTDHLLAYLADLIERMERYGCVVLPPNDADEVSWGRDQMANLVMDVEARPPLAPRTQNVELVFQERWKPAGRDAWERVEYGYELRHHGLDYRRALHRHHDDYFIRNYAVVTHEHCEAPMGHVTCSHYFGEPVTGALDAFERLYGLWLANDRPDCSSLLCIEGPSAS